MKDKSNIGYIEFLFRGMLWSIIGIYIYNNTIFRKLEGMTMEVSRQLFYGMVMGAIILGAFLVFRFYKKIWTVAVSVVMPFGAYTLMAYAKTFEKLISVSMGIACGVAILYSGILLGRRIRTINYRRNVMVNRMYQCFCRSQFIISIGLVVVISVLIIRVHTTDSIVSTSVKAESGDVPEVYVGGDMSTLRLLKEEVWENLTIEEKVDVIQTVANDEAKYLGLPHELNVKISSDKDEVQGMYFDFTRTIYINLDHLESSEASSVLETCLHEAFHSYQFRLVDAYVEINEEYHTLRIFQKPIQYEKEIDTYISGSEDYEQYKNQELEKDAKAYAESRVLEYYEKIEEYLDENEYLRYHRY